MGDGDAQESVEGPVEIALGTALGGYEEHGRHDPQQEIIPLPHRLQTRLSAGPPRASIVGFCSPRTIESTRVDPVLMAAS